MEHYPVARVAPDEALHMDEMTMNKPCSLVILSVRDTPNEWMTGPATPVG